jgi:hypothetical protein
MGAVFIHKIRFLFFRFKKMLHLVIVFYVCFSLPAQKKQIKHPLKSSSCLTGNCELTQILLLHRTIVQVSFSCRNVLPIAIYFRTAFLFLNESFCCFLIITKASSNMSIKNSSVGRKLARLEMKRISGGKNNSDIVCFRCLFSGPGSGEACHSTSLSSGPDMFSLCQLMYGSSATAMVVDCTNECDL